MSGLSSQMYLRWVARKIRHANCAFKEFIVIQKLNSLLTLEQSNCTVIYDQNY